MVRTTLFVALLILAGPSFGETCNTVLAAPTVEELSPLFHTETGAKMRRQQVTLNGKPVVFYFEYPGVKASKEKVAKIRAALGESSRFVNLDDKSAIENDVSVNCHGFACWQSGISYLPERTWIRGSASKSTLGYNPIRVLLENEFEKVDQWSWGEETALANDPRLREGDYLLFSNGPDAAIHSGILIANPTAPESQDRFWVRSKIASYMTVDAPIEKFQLLEAQGIKGYQYTVIEIWRRKESTAR